MHTIYVLQDPRTDEVRYVGVTNRGVRRRLNEHLAEARRGSATYRSRWIRLLLSDGVEPVATSLLEVSSDMWQEAERAAIAAYRDTGTRLVNVTDGGEGAPGRIVTAATRERMRAANTGKRHADETRLKMSASCVGRRHTAHTRAKIGAARLGSHLSAETCAKLRAINIGRRHTQESIAKIAEASKGRMCSPETRAKMSASQKARQASPEVRARQSASIMGLKRSVETCARIGAAHRGKKLSQEARVKLSKSVRCIETGQVFLSTVDASTAVGLSRGKVSRAVKSGGTAGGYHWEFVA